MKRALVAVVLLSAFAGAAAAAGGDAQATGKWTVESQTLELHHARAFRETDPFGKGTNPCVLISNEPVPDDAVPNDEDGIAKLLDRMRDGATRAFQVCFDATGAKLRNVNDVVVFHPGISPGRFVLQGFHQFAAKSGAGTIAGKLTGSGETMSGGSWSDEVDLSAPIPRD